MQPYHENFLREILFENTENREEIKSLIQQMWKKRELNHRQ